MSKEKRRQQREKKELELWRQKLVDLLAASEAIYHKKTEWDAIKNVGRTAYSQKGWDLVCMRVERITEMKTVVLGVMTEIVKQPFPTAEISSVLEDVQKMTELFGVDEKGIRSALSQDRIMTTDDQARGRR